MNNKHEKDLQKIQREIATIPQDVLDAWFKLFERDSFSARLDAHLAVRSDLFRPHDIIRCTQTDLLVISGRNWTDSTGVVTLPIQFCGDVTGNATQLGIIREPNFVATPYGPTPSFITVIPRSTTRQLSTGEFLLDRAGRVLSERNVLVDISVDVMSWRGNEAPAVRIEFSWICIVEAARLANASG